MRKILAFLALGVLVLPLLSAAAKAPRPYKVDPDYARKFGTAQGTFMTPATSWLTLAPQAYYKVYGSWPENWQALRASGLIQVDLISPEGYVIDPDDDHWDGPDDARYVIQPNGKPPRIYSSRDGKKFVWEDIPTPPQTLTQYLKQLTQVDGQDYGFIYGEESRLKLVALAGLLNEAVRLFIVQYGRLPGSFVDLLASGLAPVDLESVNPVTGAHFLGDGSPSDFLYRTTTSPNFGRSAQGRWYELFITDGSGQTWRFDYE